MNIELIGEPKNIQLCGRGSVQNDTSKDKDRNKEKERIILPEIFARRRGVFDCQDEGHWFYIPLLIGQPEI